MTTKCGKVLISQNGLCRLGGASLKKVISLIIMIGILMAVGIMLFSFQSRSTADFATDIIVKYKYEDHNVDAKIYDDTDIVALKSILNGKGYTDSPSCGFSVDVSITLSSNQKTVVLCPALDGCPIIKINETNKYFVISNEDRTKLDIILEKYGFKFPSI